jgi:hypothetical protein
MGKTNPIAALVSLASSFSKDKLESVISKV